MPSVTAAIFLRRFPLAPVEMKISPAAGNNPVSRSIPFEIPGERADPAAAIVEIVRVTCVIPLPLEICVGLKVQVVSAGNRPQL
jgi:hypothetical protein